MSFSLGFHLLLGVGLLYWKSPGVIHPPRSEVRFELATIPVVQEPPPRVVEPPVELPKPVPPVPVKDPVVKKSVPVQKQPPKVRKVETPRPLPVAAAAPVVAAAIPAAKSEPITALPVEVYRPPDVRAAYAANPKPVYPHSARRMGREGEVLLTVEVTAEGGVARVTIQTGSGVDSLDQAALEAVARWRFVPAQRNGRNVAATVTVPIRFQLQKE
ncbi:MAG: energy transducer TonB [Magnetococcales bacterium]|nr:energy transducer TonB [Magnetococcales bacterium]